MPDAPPLTRRCSATDRPLELGEVFWTALVDEGGRIERRDYAADAWPGAPAGALAHWTGRVPELRSSRRPTVDDELLWECFSRLADRLEPDQVAFRYVVALLLMRRRRLRFEDTRKDATGEWLLVRDGRGGDRLEVRDPGLTEADAERVQAEVERVLGWS